MTTSTLFAQANPGSVSSGAGNAGTNGIHFTVSATSQLDGVWHYSPATSTQLPTTIALYTTQASPATGTLVTSQAASWSGAAGSGWVFAAFTSPPALAAGTNYMAANWRNDATNEWFVFYAVTWPVTSGIITAPKDTGTGQGWFNTATPTALTFPATQLAGDNFGMDVQVTSGGGPVTVALPAAQATTAAFPPGSSAGPVALPAAAATATAFPLIAGTALPLPAARATATAFSPGSSAGPVALPAAAATATAFPVVARVTVPLPAGQAAAQAYPLATGPAAVGLPVAAATARAFPVMAGGPVSVALAVAQAVAQAYPLALPRRLLVSIAARAGTDDYGNPYPQGLQVTDGVIEGSVISGSVFEGVNWLEDSDGQFLYGGAPALGNLLLSVAPQSGTDAHGNDYNAGVWAYSSGDAVGLFNVGGIAPALIFDPINAHVTISAQVFVFTTNTGLANEVQFLAASSGKESGGADAAIQYASESADGTIPARLIFEFGGAVAGTWTAGGALVADAWHNITLDSGWTSVVTPQYRLLPDGNVQVRGQASHAGVTASTNINGSNPVPAAYQPAAARIYRPPTAGDSAGTVGVTTAGVFQMRASGFTATQVFLDGIYSV